MGVIIVNYAIADAKTHWLEGLVLVIIYVVIGISILYVFSTHRSLELLLTELSYYPAT